MTDIIKKAIADFEKEFPTHDTSHCSGHTAPTFEGHPNPNWVKQWIEREMIAYEEKIKASEQERMRGIIGKMEKYNINACSSSEKNDEINKLIRNNLRIIMLAKLEGGKS